MICCLALTFAGALAILRGLVPSLRAFFIGALALAAVGTPLAAWALTSSKAPAPICSLSWLKGPPGP